jgi:polyphosphate glucokinase
VKINSAFELLSSAFKFQLSGFIPLPTLLLMKVLTIDVGGTHVKILLSGEKEPRKIPSGPAFTPRRLVEDVKKLAEGWKYAVISIGFPSPIHNNAPVAEPFNLGKGWVDFDYEKAFGCPVKMINDAAMQALGSYKGGKMLFLGFGTGLGSAVVTDDALLPLELGHLPFKKKTFEDYVGVHGLEKSGKDRWTKHVFETVEILTAAILPDYVVLGGGNVKKLKELPPACIAGDNANAFIGGFRLWEGPADSSSKPDPAIRKAARATRSKKTAGKK